VIHQQPDNHFQGKRLSTNLSRLILILAVCDNAGVVQLSTPDTFDVRGDRRSNRSLDRFPTLVRSEKSQSMGGSQMLLLRLLSPEKTEDREGKVWPGAIPHTQVNPKSLPS
jgi:hypothetical protein